MVITAAQIALVFEALRELGYNLVEGCDFCDFVDAGVVTEVLPKRVEWYLAQQRFLEDRDHG